MPKWNLKLKVAAGLMAAVLVFAAGVWVGNANQGDITLDDTSVFEGDIRVSGIGTFGSLIGALPYSNLTGIARGSTVCVNGTWVKHDLGVIPSNIILTIDASGYINSTCSYVTPTVIAKNSSHFQIGFYLRFQPIDRLSEVTPVAAGWDTAPSDLANSTDNDWSTATGIGNNTVVAGIVGNLTWDMGDTYGVELRSKTGVWSDTFTMDIKWYWSVDNASYYPTTNTVSSQITATTETIMFSQIEYAVARYIRLVTEHVGGSSACNAKFYECQAWDLVSAVLPVTAANQAPIFWTTVV